MKKPRQPRTPKNSAKSTTFDKPLFVDFRQLEHVDPKTRMELLLNSRDLVNDMIRDERRRAVNLIKWRRRK